MTHATDSFRILLRVPALGRCCGWAVSFRDAVDIRKRLRIFRAVKTRNTFEGRPIQVIWKNIWENDGRGAIRFRYRPDPKEDTMRVVTTKMDDPRFGWSNRELDTLED